MKRIAVLFLLGMMTPVFAAAEKVIIATDVWTGYVNRDQTGCYVDILNEILRKNGVDYQLLIDDYDRCKVSFARGKADALLGAYANEVHERALYPVWHIDCSVTQVIFRSGGHTWLDERTLFGKRVAWQTGFDMDVMLTVPVTKMEVGSVDAGLAAVRADKADFYIEERDILHDYLRSHSASAMTSLTAINFYKKKIYLVFSPALGETAKLWDREFLKMIRDGRLKAVFVKWGMMKENETVTSYFMEGAH